MLIVLINAITVILGGVVGSFLKKGIPDALKQAILFSIGLYVVYLGIAGLSSEVQSVVLLLSVVLGTLCGTALHLDDAMNRGAQRSRSESLNLAGNKCINKSRNDCLQSFSTLGLTVLISVL